MPKHDPFKAPRKFPVLLDEFLRIVLGGKYRKVRLKTFCHYLRATVPASGVDEVLNRYRTKGFDEVWFEIARADMLRWLKLRRTEKARKAAYKRWSQNRRKKANAGKLQILKNAVLDRD